MGSSATQSYVTSRGIRKTRQAQNKRRPPAAFVSVYWSSLVGATLNDSHLQCAELNLTLNRDIAFFITDLQSYTRPFSIPVQHDHTEVVAPLHRSNAMSICRSGPSTFDVNTCIRNPRPELRIEYTSTTAKGNSILAN